jgi:hypothetical protein
MYITTISRPKMFLAGSVLVLDNGKDLYLEYNFILSLVSCSINYSWQSECSLY